MECYRHAPTAAVAVCRTCGCAVCKECAIDSGVPVPCSEACAKEAADVHEMNQRGKKIYGIGTARRTVATTVLIWFVFTVTFLGDGIFLTWRRGEPEWFLLTFGAGSLLVGVLAYRRSRDIGLQL